MLGISESTWKVMESMLLKMAELVVYVGDDEVQKGEVAIMMSARAETAMMEWALISKRIRKARF